MYEIINREHVSSRTGCANFLLYRPFAPGSVDLSALHFRLSDGSHHPAAYRPQNPPFGEWPGGRTGVAYWLHVASEMEFAHPCSGATFAFCKIINWGDVFLLGNFRTLPGELKARPVLRTKIIISEL